MRKIIGTIGCLVCIVFLAKAQLNRSNLPVISISSDETIRDEPKVNATMSVYENGDLSQVPKKYKIGVEFRGSSSQNFVKKSLRIETRNEDGSNLNVELLGFPADNDWFIIAPHNDKSLMRDHLTYHLVRQMGRYASRTKFVEIILNGSYYGVGFLAEKIKQGKNRVDIADLKETETSGDQLTGGYIVKIDKTTGGYSPNWRSNYVSGRFRTLYQVEYPKADKLKPEQLSYIRRLLDTFENTMQEPSYKDPAKGYAKMIDMASFVDFLLINELSRNVDGYRLSSYFYKDKDSKNPRLVMGPAWDFNLGFGNADYYKGWETSGWAFNHNIEAPDDGFSVPFWWEKMLNDPAFVALAKDRWNGFRKNVLSDQNILKNIDSTATLLNEAQNRNFLKYPIWGQYLWPNKYIASSYSDELNYLKNWISARTKWLDNSNLLIDLKNVLANEALESQSVNVYPNPVMKTATYTFYNEKAATVTLKIVDTQGRTVKSMPVQNLPKGVHSYVLDFEQESAGIYFLNLEKNAKLVATNKIVVKK